MFTSARPPSICCLPLLIERTRPSYTRQFVTSVPNRGRPPPELSGLTHLTSEQDHAAARSWVQTFSTDDIPKGSLDVSYSRSSGPGGQHVNKTNSKATIRCKLDGSDHWLPAFVLPPLRKSPYHLSNPDSLLLSSQKTRTASQNYQTALGLLHEAILSAAKSTIVGQTSVEQKNRVKKLIKAEDGRRRMQKDKRSSKKAARRGD